MSDEGEVRQQGSDFLNWSWQFALTLGILTVLGHWLDGQLGTGALCIVIGILMGLFGGFYRLYVLVKNLPPTQVKKKGSVK